MKVFLRSAAACLCRRLLSAGMVLCLLCAAACSAQPQGDSLSGSGSPQDAGAAAPQSTVVLDNDTVKFVLSPLPEGLDKNTVMACNVPGRQQQWHFSADRTVRIVLEVQDIDEDAIPGAEYQTVTVGEVTGRLYCCTEGGLQLAEPEAIVQDIAAPQPGEWIVEWQADGYALRLYGSFAPEDLLTAAGQVVMP